MDDGQLPKRQPPPQIPQYQAPSSSTHYDAFGNVYEDDTTDEDDSATWINVKRILKVIPRDNPNDPFKPHSVKAISKLGEYGKRPSEELTPEEISLLQNYGADIDLDTTFDKTEPPGVTTDQISKESKGELAKLPEWLRSFIESKFPAIQAQYKNNTHTLLKMFANRLEYRKMKRWALVHPDEDETEIRHQIDDETYGEVMQMEEALVTRPDDDDDDDERLNEYEHRNREHVEMDPFRKNDVLQVAPEDADMDLWSPLLMQRAADALRAVMLAGASDSEGENPEEGEWEDDSDKLAEMRSKRKSFMQSKEDESVYKGPHWEDVVARKQHFAEKAAWKAGLEFTPTDQRKKFVLKNCRRYDADEKEDNPGSNKTNKKPDNTKKSESKLPSEKDEDSDGWENVHDDELFESNNSLKNRYYSTDPGHPLYRKPQNESQRRARQFRERGVGKRPSRVYVKDPCKGPVSHVTRELHQIRPTEGVHAYVNFITGSVGFRNFILIVILFNAVLLAAETGERKRGFQVIFDVFDSIFLSVYCVEFVLKCYSNPLEYFRSGFNWFDFFILIFSLVKASFEWSGNGASIPFLRFFIVIRALRVLRGVSLSIHTQVLVTALVATLKNHVLSVVILLVLLMYIAAIVAFYLFSDKPVLHETWGEVPMGMLRLFSFVTMDGWTEVMEEFEKANMLHGGRMFCLICIVFGNFVFSNIFIAIIIMQISEATDSFRKTQTDEKESSVFLKQESVFRRQKLDMRQLLSRHKLGISEDFYELGSRFVRRLQHDDLVDARDVIFSPLWVDSFYKAMQRAHHTSNVLMNLHRKMSDRLVKLNNLYNDGKSVTRGISRARYNRYLDVKGRLQLLKQQFLDLRNVPEKRPIRVKLPDLVSTEEHAKPPPRPPPMPKRPLWKDDGKNRSG